jgi:para-aminobenzoate synthetase component 1
LPKKTYLKSIDQQILSLQEDLNQLGKQRLPFLFVISYDMKTYDLIPLEKIPKDIEYDMSFSQNIEKENIQLSKEPIGYENYLKKFEYIQKNIREGNTYLINLTTPTKINNTLNLHEIYTKAIAPYKLYYKDKFVCFSPEKFCKIDNNEIYTYPMKGTIDASTPNAKQTILEDQKELAEHTMVVDLLRNDLSQVASKVKVEKFRYIDTIQSGENTLLQVSSKIKGQLEKNWQDNIGDILCKMLPAGSITGAPKKSTIDILEQTENYNRGFYTGVFGIFDGKSLDSAVMIRFIERDEDGSLIYKSGGGLTCDSDPKKEYDEMIQKVYIP